MFSWELVKAMGVATLGGLLATLVVDGAWALLTYEVKTETTEADANG